MNNYYLSPEEIAEIQKVAEDRVKEQVGDGNSGKKSATYSFGGQSSMDARSLETRRKNALMGALGEFIGSKLMKCEWIKEMGQYKGNKEPDLLPILNGYEVRVDARTKPTNVNTVIFRERDFNSRDEILFALMDSPSTLSKDTYSFRAGWRPFKDLAKLVDEHPEWEGKNSMGAKYYEVPFEYFLQDFSKFGETK